MPMVEVTSHGESLLIKISEAEVKCRVICIEVYTGSIVNGMQKHHF